MGKLTRVVLKFNKFDFDGIGFKLCYKLPMGSYQKKKVTNKVQLNWLNNVGVYKKIVIELDSYGLKKLCYKFVNKLI